MARHAVAAGKGIQDGDRQMLSFLWLFSMRCLEEMGRFQRFFLRFWRGWFIRILQKRRGPYHFCM